MYGGPVPSRQPWRGQGHGGCHEVSTQSFTQPWLGFTIQLRMLAGCSSACCVLSLLQAGDFWAVNHAAAPAELAEGDPKVPSNSSPSQRSLCEPFLRADTSPWRAVLLPSCSHSSPTGLPARSSTHSRILPLQGSSQPRPVTPSWLGGQSTERHREHSQTPGHPLSPDSPERQPKGP